MKKIAIFTAARSDFGILKNLIQKMEEDRRFNLNLIINSIHKSNKFGTTINEIDQLRIKKKIYLNFNYKGSNSDNIINYFNNVTKQVSNYIKKNIPKAFIIMGDRYEMLACAFSCLQYHIPIIHLCGGSITLGSLDNIYRNNISNMADLHLVESKFHKKRLIEIGIEKNIHIVGAPALENISKLEKISLLKIINEFSIKIDLNKKIVVACFHPETNVSVERNTVNLKKFLSFLKSRNENIIFTYPNADNGFNKFIKHINLYLSNKKNCSVVKNLGINNYYSLLQKSDVLIGNSSSGIIESSSFKIPTINLGNRQKMRFHAKNVIHSSFETKDLKKSINKALSKKFNKNISNLKNPFFKKDTSGKIINIINKCIK